MIFTVFRKEFHQFGYFFWWIDQKWIKSFTFLTVTINDMLLYLLLSNSANRNNRPSSMKILWRSCDPNRITLLLGTTAVAFLNSYGSVFVCVRLCVRLYMVCVCHEHELHFIVVLMAWSDWGFRWMSCLLMCHNCRTRCSSIVERNMSAGKISRAIWWVNFPVLSDLIQLPYPEMTSGIPYCNVSIKDKTNCITNHKNSKKTKQKNKHGMTNC